MNSLKKIILLCLIPTVLTIVFIIMFTVPAVSECINISKQIKETKTSIKTTQANIETLKANKRILNDLKKLNAELAVFEIEYPSEFQDAIFLIDLEMFANEAFNKVFEVKSLSEKMFEKQTAGKKKKRKKRRSKRSKKEEKKPPVQLMEKSFEVKTIARYNEIIAFVACLESYQRKVNLTSITAKVFSDDQDLSNPRIETKISGNIYKSLVNKVQKQERPKDAKSKK